MKLNPILLSLVMSVIAVLSISNAHAAFCSLRDPVSAMQTLYQDDFQYRSLVANVSPQDRLAVKQILPFTIHQNEVSKHTLYVLYQERKAVGFLQARSEWAKWGLIEIAWAINLDRSLKGFYFQRCRSPECNDAVTQSINEQLENKNFEQLKELLDSSGKALSKTGEQAFSNNPILARLVLQSALKTLAITNISWAKEIAMLENSNNNHDH